MRWRGSTMRLLARLAMASILMGGMLFMPRMVGSQDEGPRKEPKRDIIDKADDEKGPRGPGGFGGPMMGQVRKIVKQFDKDSDGRLNRDERNTARESLKKDGGGRGPFGKGPGGFFGKANQDPPKPGPHVDPS